jgi:hypothetical protein
LCGWRIAERCQKVAGATPPDSAGKISNNLKGCQNRINRSADSRLLIGQVSLNEFCAFKIFLSSGISAVGAAYL